MESKILVNQNEVVEFAKMYEHLSKSVKADLNYLLNARLRAFFKNGVMVGGYAVSTVEMNQELRYLTFLNPSQKEALKLKGIKADEYAEITYIFVDNEKVDYRQNIKIMLFSLWDAMLRRKKFIMGGGAIERFNSRMQNLLKTKVFDETIKISGEYKNFKILITPTLKMLIDLPKVFWKEIRKKKK